MPKKASLDLLSGQWLHRVKTTNLHAHACGLFILAHVHASVLHLLVRFSRWGKQFRADFNSRGGVLSGKVGTGMCGSDRVLFRPLRFNGPFFSLKIGLDTGHVFAKYILTFSMNFSFSLPMGCQKVLTHTNLHG